MQGGGRAERGGEGGTPGVDVEMEGMLLGMDTVPVLHAHE
jgi:hypothetical protein